MYKIGKTNRTSNEEINIFLTNASSYKIDAEINKSVIENEFKEINFVITGSLGKDSYSLSFMFKGPVEKLLDLDKRINYDIEKFIYFGETILGINDKEYYTAFIKGNILRTNDDKYVIDITFNTEENEYFGYLEFDFLLNEYLSM